jgi:hypothetical protein
MQGVKALHPILKSGDRALSPKAQEQCPGVTYAGIDEKTVHIPVQGTFFLVTQIVLICTLCLSLEHFHANL